MPAILPMEFIAIRENCMREAYPEAVRWHRHPGMGFGASLSEEVTPEFVRDEVAADSGRRRLSHVGIAVPALSGVEDRPGAGRVDESAPEPLPCRWTEQ